MSGENEHDDTDDIEEGDHHVPVELVELYEVLEWQAAVEQAESPS